jgi:hypothetical protein
MRELEQVPDVLPDNGLSEAEIEVRLAIADYAIRRLTGTQAGQEAFQALVTQFQGRYPQHKLLTQLLIAPEYIDVESPPADHD